MLVKKVWLEVRKNGLVEWERQGWYLFGLIPLYIRDMGPRERRT